ncbi:DHA2 family efflux MFS transporter permease subunit [Lolliginicoccus suaedae]|uniref:DHA2 family efflux MFS transporter permease subunit n=1 Tax=Lolliginicoccus suaedae TaxID=2605429 RepID=UPI0011EBF0A0|nr:DHA2 family efflux MFS transporter permease subunit [Lolliginicoccus suaedae]
MHAAAPSRPGTPPPGSWAALWALCLGFFMILVDSTIVAVAVPSIMASLGTDIATTVWASSAYLLAFAVPLLITGRLGDSLGPKRVYMAGLVVFTLSSLACGLAGTIGLLIAARVVQGLGASLMNPQTMAIITRLFPAQRRGAALGMWGAVAGAATLAGPLLGGLLVGTLGWEWIFFVNVPLGMLALVLAWRLVPDLPRTARALDVPSVVLSAAAMFLVVFAIQEGQRYGWGRITGLVTIPGMLAVGVVLLAVFVIRQHRLGGRGALMPLSLFAQRNFTLAAIAISTMGLAMTSMFLPLMVYLQDGRGLDAMRASLLIVPVAVLSGILAPVVGRVIDRIDARLVAVPSMLLLAGATAALGWLMAIDATLGLMLVPLSLIGLANAGIWSPLSTTATRGLAAEVAGAGAGVYNTTRQTGAVLGSAGIAALMEARLGSLATAGDPAAFSMAMGQSLLLPAIAVAGGAVAAMFLRPGHDRVAGQ